jgi:hypothetical protein
MSYLKKIGPIVAVVMALAAFAGVASASAAEFHASASGTSLNGTQTTSHVFSTQGNEVTCETATFSGSTEGTSSPTQKMAPTYSGCTAFGFAGATVNTEGCKYNFHASGTVDLESCTAGFINITVNVPLFAKCVVHVPNQTGINGQTYTNQSPRTSLVVGTKSTNVSSTVVTSTGLCPLSTGAATSSYTGTTKVTPASGEIWVE